MDSDDTSEIFYRRIADALTGCQLVEQELKLYIAKAYEVIGERVGDRVPFKWHGSDVEDWSLERLINAFKKLSDSDQLIQDLNEFKKQRNFLTHKGIAYCLNPDLEFDDQAKAEVEARLDKMQPEAERLWQAIGRAATVLWFDNLEE